MFRVESAYRTKSFNDCLKCCDESLEKYPDNLKLLQWKAAALWFLKEWKDCSEWCSECLEKHPEDLPLIKIQEDADHELDRSIHPRVMNVDEAFERWFGNS
ncbi:hypothetical protein FJZ53_02530 [Candidatus Woesearchaeota archaeon]|nr:hypothetical protein [Candidatus Woesearchaeota archaeon]